MTRPHPIAPAPPPVPLDVEVVERSDGYYWISRDRRREIGPYASAAEAFEDGAGLVGLDVVDGGEQADSLAQAEDALGIAAWIDPDTGTPSEEARPRLEEH